MKSWNAKDERGRRKGRYGNDYTHGENGLVNLMAQTTTGRWVMGAAALLVMPVAMSVLMAERLWAGQVAAPQASVPQAAAAPTAAPQAKTPPQASAAVANAGPELGEVLDRLVAVVNGDVILESDVDEERRFEQVQAYRPFPPFFRGGVLGKVINPAPVFVNEALGAGGEASG